MSVATLTRDDLTRILEYLELPESEGLPLTPVPFLAKYLPILPTSLLLPFANVTNPRERAAIPSIKARRLMHANSTPKPGFLHADRGRLRWPLLWERMGGSSLPKPSANVDEEEQWVKQSFLPGKENSQHVKKLGGFFRDLQEEREIFEVIDRKRVERRLDAVGEEFDEESDEEDEGDLTNYRTVQQAPLTEAEEEAVREAFEKRVLELFVDGLDTISYDEIDFEEPPGGDPIAAQDRLEAYFDDEAPNRTPNGHEAGAGSELGGNASQNGQGEYDY